MKIRHFIFPIVLILCAFLLFPATGSGQKLLLLDRSNGDKVVNDSTIYLYSNDTAIPDLTALFTMKNNTDVPLSVFLRKKVNQMNDSTTDYYCFYIKCWPDTDTTDIADTIPPGGEDYTFASHVCHIRRFDYPQPTLPPGFSSITYTIYDHTSLPEPVEASVTVVYHLSPLSVEEPGISSVQVYPNPARDFIRLTPKDHLKGECRVKIFNLQGSRVLQQYENIREHDLTLSVESLSAGLYTGIITTSRGTTSSFRFLKK